MAFTPDKLTGFKPDKPSGFKADPVEQPKKKKDGVLKRVGKGFKQEFVGQDLAGPRALKKIPIVGGVIGTMENLEISRAAKRLSGGWDYGKYLVEPRRARMKGDVFDHPGVKADRTRDESMVADFMKREVEKAQLGKAGMVGQGLADMPTFMAEFMMTGGLHKFGSLAVRKMGRKYLKDYASTLAGRAALRTAGWSAGAITRASVGLAPRVTEEAALRRAQVNLELRDDESAATSVLKAWAGTVIEAASESAGESKFLGRLIRNNSKLGKVLVPKLENAWIMATGGTKGEFARRMFKKAGKADILSEIGEERLSTVLNAVFEVEDFGAGKDASKIDKLKAGLIQDAENFGVEVAVLLPVAGGQVAVGQTMGALTKWTEGAEARAEKKLEKLEESERKDKLAQIKKREKQLTGEGMHPDIARRHAWRERGEEAPGFEMTDEGQVALNRIQEKMDAGEELTEQENEFLDIATSPEETGKWVDGATHTQLAAIHRLSAALKESEDQYRSTLKEKAGVESLTEADQGQAEEIMNHYINEAEKAGIDYRPALSTLQHRGKKKFPGQGMLRMLTPQDYVIKRAGLGFMLEPARRAKRRHGVEFKKLQEQNRKMMDRVHKYGKETLRTRLGAAWSNKPTAASEYFFDLLDKYEKPLHTWDQEEKDIFNYFRSLTHMLIERENAVREKLGDEPIQNRKAYIRHIATEDAMEMFEGRRPMSEQMDYYLSKHAPKKVANPTEMRRVLENDDKLIDRLFTKDLGKVADAMSWTALKEIHLNEPLKHFDNMIKMFSEELPKHWRVWAEGYIREMIVGHETDIDKRWNKAVAEGGIAKALNAVLKPFNRKVGKRPITTLFSKLSAMRILGVLGPRPKQIIRNKFQLLQNLMFFDPKSIVKSYMKKDDPMLTELMRSSDFFEAYGGHEEFANAPKSVTEAWLKFYQWSAVSNVDRTMRVAYHDALDLITNRKYKRYGWADEQRDYTEPEGFLYDSERKRILEEMEFGAGLTQYSYMAMDMPQLFRYKVGKPLTGLQSWWMSYFFKFLREGMQRTFTGRTSSGYRVPPNRRAGMLRYLLVSGTVLNAMGYGRSFLLGVAPGQPPILESVLALLDWAKQPEDERKRDLAWRKTVSTLSMFVPGYLAAKDLYKIMEEDGDITSLFFYNDGLFEQEEKERKSGAKRQRRKVQRRKPTR